MWNSLTAKDLFVPCLPLDTSGNSPGLASRWDPWVDLLLTYLLLSRFHRIMALARAPRYSTDNQALVPWENYILTMKQQYCNGCGWACGWALGKWAVARVTLGHT